MFKRKKTDWEEKYERAMTAVKNCRRAWSDSLDQFVERKQYGLANAAYHRIEQCDKILESMEYIAKM